MTNGGIYYKSKAMMVFLISLLVICFALKGLNDFFGKVTDNKPIEKVVE